MNVSTVAGLSQLNVAKIFAEARHRIILHAPPYGAFGTNAAIARALESALAQPDGASLTALCLPDMQAYPWVHDFMSVLRPQYDSAAREQELTQSRLFLRHLASSFPNRVHVLEMHVAPLIPLLVVDDTVIFGQTAHSSVMTKEGFWSTCSMGKADILDAALHGIEPIENEREQRAVFRILSEYVHSLKQAKPISL